MPGRGRHLHPNAWQAEGAQYMRPVVFITVTNISHKNKIIDVTDPRKKFLIQTSLSQYNSAIFFPFLIEFFLKALIFWLQLLSDNLGFRNIHSEFLTQGDY